MKIKYILDLKLKIIICVVSFIIISSGLIASTIHLGHPERAWRALSQWRSSWLSREGVAAIFTFVPLIFFYFFWIFQEHSKLTSIILILCSILCLITIFCTAKIYSSLKTIPAWNNRLVPIIFILNSLVLGSIFLFTIFFYFEIKIFFLSNFVILICLVTFFLKLIYWHSISQPSKSNIYTATGLGSKSKTNFFEGPHTGKNFLTTEMINKINISKSFILRIAFCILTYITPAFFIYQEPGLVISDSVSSITFIIITILSLIGMCMERYLFFIDSKHTVSLYYGSKTI